MDYLAKAQIVYDAIAMEVVGMRLDDVIARAEVAYFPPTGGLERFVIQGSEDIIGHVVTSGHLGIMVDAMISKFSAFSGFVQFFITVMPGECNHYEFDSPEACAAAKLLPEDKMVDASSSVVTTTGVMVALHFDGGAITGVFPVDEGGIVRYGPMQAEIGKLTVEGAPDATLQ